VPAIARHEGRQGCAEKALDLIHFKYLTQSLR